MGETISSANFLISMLKTDKKLKQFPYLNDAKQLDYHQSDGMHNECWTHDHDVMSANKQSIYLFQTFFIVLSTESHLFCVSIKYTQFILNCIFVTFSFDF